MIIRSKQFNKFEDEAWKDFLNRTLYHLRSDLEEYTRFSENELIKRIERTIEIANNFELLEEPDIICFLDAGFILEDENFAHNQDYFPIRVILEDENLSSSEKAEQTLILAWQQKITTTKD